MAQEALKFPSRPHVSLKPPFVAAHAERHPEIHPSSIEAENIPISRIHAATLAEKIAKLKYAHALAQSFADKLPVDAKTRDLKQVREKFQHRHISSVIFAILEKNTTDPLLMDFLQQPDVQQMVEEITKTGEEIEDYYAHEATKIGDLKAMAIVGNVVRESGNSTPAQIYDILTTAGYSSNVSKRIVKLLDLGKQRDKIAVGTVINLLAGRASELTAGLAQLLFHDQMNQYFASVDTFHLLLLAVLSQAGVYAAIHIKNNASIHAAKRYATMQKDAFVPDPLPVYEDALMDAVLEDDKGVGDRVKRNVGKWVAHFMNPLNISDELWYGTLALPNGLEIFITGNGAAIAIKIALASGVEYISHRAAKNAEEHSNGANSHTNGNGKNGIRNLTGEVNQAVFDGLNGLLADEEFKKEIINKCRKLGAKFKFENEKRQEGGVAEPSKTTFTESPFVKAQTIYSFSR